MPARDAAAVPLTWDQVRGHRLRRHGLFEPLPAGCAAEVASVVCGIHAQVGSAAALSLSRRVRGADAGLLSDGLWRDRSLVKTYGPRGTVHVFSADELSLWTAATRALPAQGARQPSTDVPLISPTPDQAEQLQSAVLSVTHGTQLTRAELGTAITEICGAWVDTQASPAWKTGWPHWRLAVDEAVARGVLCFGPPQGNRVTFVRADEWLAGTSRQRWIADGDATVGDATAGDATVGDATAGDATAGDATAGDAPAVLVEVARRYLAAYGPATHQEFGQWFALPAGRARNVYAALSDELVAVDVEGTRSWALGRTEPHTWGPVSDCVRLLGYFDCFTVGSHPRDELAPPAAAARAAGHGRGFAKGSARRFLCGPLPVLLVDGVVRGVWTYRQHSGAEQVRVEVFGRAGAGLRRQLRDEVARLAELLNRDLTLSVGPADIAAHL